MQNKPNFRKVKTNLTFSSAKYYENKPPIGTMGKQTQFIPTEGRSNPIYSELVESIANRAKSSWHNAKWLL